MNALHIGERTVTEEMIPREGIVALSTEAPIEENLERMSKHPHTRYPLVGEDLSEFEGIVYFPVLERHREELKSGELTLRDVAAPPMTLSPDTTVSDAIDQFQTETQELALVVDDGEIVGMVTVTDLLESVMGDIEDPLDRDELAPDGE
jgi:CBS domain containing-hemolysin-like protein